MVDRIFDIEVEYEGKILKGWINPSEKLNVQGVPSSFHVVLNDTSFGYLSFQNCKWSVNEERPGPLVKLIGRQIEKHYQF